MIITSFKKSEKKIIKVERNMNVIIMIFSILFIFLPCIGKCWKNTFFSACKHETFDLRLLNITGSLPIFYIYRLLITYKNDKNVNTHLTLLNELYNKSGEPIA